MDVLHTKNKATREGCLIRLKGVSMLCFGWIILSSTQTIDTWWFYYFWMNFLPFWITTPL